MKAYFDNVRKDVPENIHDIFLEKEELKLNYRLI